MKNTLKMMAAAFVMVAFSSNVQAITLVQNAQVEQEKDGVKQDGEKKSCCKSKEGKEKKSCCKSKEEKSKKSCCKSKEEKK